MGFPARLLNDEEEIALDLRPHWVYFAKPAAAVLVLLVAAIWFRNASDWITVPVYVLLLGAAVWLAVTYARWSTTHFVVTSDRLIFRHGVLAKHGIEIPLERVNNVIFNQSIIERMLRAGDLLIESAGESGQQRFSDIQRPDLVQNEIYRQMEDNENRKFDRIGGTAGPAAPSIPEQIDQLDDLRRRGVISDAEFEAKKQDLLDRM